MATRSVGTMVLGMFAAPLFVRRWTGRLTRRADLRKRKKSSITDLRERVSGPFWTTYGGRVPLPVARKAAGWAKTIARLPSPINYWSNFLAKKRSLGGRGGQVLEKKSSWLAAGLDSSLPLGGWGGLRLTKDSSVCGPGPSFSWAPSSIQKRKSFFSGAHINDCRLPKNRWPRIVLRRTWRS